MIRYMSIDRSEDRDFDTEVAHEIESDVFILDKKPLDVPYIKLDIKIVGKEERYIDERTAPKGKRTCGDIIKSILVGGWK